MEQSEVAVSYKLIVSAALCATLGCRSVSSPGLEPIAPMSAPATAATYKTVILEVRRGTVPGVTVSVPQSWQHTSPQGIDTAIHEFSGDGVQMHFEHWAIDSNLICHQASCGLVRIPLSDRYAEIN